MLAVLAVACDFTEREVAVAATGLSQAKTQVATGKAVVVAGHPEVAAMGAGVLARGGSAVDAAVVISLALGVAEPYGSGLGGKFVALYFDRATGTVNTIEALDAAPAGFTAEFASRLSRDQRTVGWGAVAIPGLPAGIEALHRSGGRLEWGELVEEAASYAQHGALVLERTREFFARREDRIRSSRGAVDLFLPSGELPAVGSRLTNTALADTLRLMAEHGAEGFYRGSVASAIATASGANGGRILETDLARYRSRQPVTAEVTVRDRRVFSSPPPTSGGSLLLTALAALDGADLGPRSILDPQSLHAIGQTLRSLYPSVQAAIADDPSSAAALERMLEAASSTSGEASVENVIARSESGTPDGVSPAATSTTHFVVIDSDGNAVSVTQSLSHHFGAGVVAPGTGVLMNNTLKNFTYDDPDSVNRPGPNKRPRTTIAPTIVTTDSQPVTLELALGVPGGQRIPTATLQVLLDVLVYDSELSDAIARQRVHLRRPLDGSPAVEFEFEGNSNGFDPLREFGWSLAVNRDTETFGGFCAAATVGAAVIGVADLRRTNAAVAVD